MSGPSQLRDEPVEAGELPPTTAPGDRSALLWLERFGLPLLLVVIAVFFSVLPASGATFGTFANLRAILAEQSALGVLALAFMLPLVAREFDLSVGSVAGLSSIVTASLLTGLDGPLTGGASFPVLPAVLAGVVVGAAVGAVNGILVTRFQVNSLIATLGTATIIAGLITWHTEGASILADIPSSVTSFGVDRWIGVPSVAFVLAALALGVWYLLEHTPFGRYLLSLGSNRDAAVLVGIGVDRVLVWTFVAAGSLAGIAGALLVARQGGGVPSVGSNLTLAAIAAAFLGMTTIRPGRPNVLGTILGVLFVAVVVSGLVLAGAKPWVESVITGAVLLGAVSLSSAFRRRRGIA